MAPDHSKQVEECKDIFLTKTWLIGILGGAVLSIAGAAWSGSQIVYSNERDHKDFNNRVTALEHNAAQIDTVIHILRSRP